MQPPRAWARSMPADARLELDAAHAADSRPASLGGRPLQTGGPPQQALYENVRKKNMIEPRKIRAYQSHLLNLKFNFQEANNEIRYFRRYHKEDPESCWTKTSKQTLQGRLDMIELFLGGLERWNEARGRRDPLVEDARADFEKLRAEVDEIEKRLKRPAPLPTTAVEGGSLCPVIIIAIATIVSLSVFLFVHYSTGTL